MVCSCFFYIFAESFGFVVFLFAFLIIYVVSFVFFVECFITLPELLVFVGLSVTYFQYFFQNTMSNNLLNIKFTCSVLTDPNESFQPHSVGSIIVSGNVSQYHMQINSQAKSPGRNFS